MPIVQVILWGGAALFGLSVASKKAGEGVDILSNSLVKFAAIGVGGYLIYKKVIK